MGSRRLARSRLVFRRRLEPRFAQDRYRSSARGASTHALCARRLHLAPQKQPRFFARAEGGKLEAPPASLTPALIDDFLDALSFVCFGDIDVPPGIGRNIVRAIKLTRQVSAASELANNLE